MLKENEVLGDEAIKTRATRNGNLKFLKSFYRRRNVIIKMLTFLKANISSSIASFFDYLVTIFLVNFFRVDVVIASTTGTVLGGIVNFLIGRTWVFESRKRKVHQQAFRYGVVWTGNLALNSSGMFLLTKTLKIHYVVAKLFVSLIVGFCYNYVLQKKYVFKNN